MKFIVDQTLGGLAKWLRLCGFDTTQTRIRVQEPDSLPAPASDTTILTRQTVLARRTGRHDVLLVHADTPEDQLAEVIGHLNLDWQDFEPLKRCSRCNQLLVPVSGEAVRGRVPEYIYHQYRQFYECPHCQRVFWAGSHVAAINRQIKALQNQALTPSTLKNIEKKRREA